MRQSTAHTPRRAARAHRPRPPRRPRWRRRCRPRRRRRGLWRSRRRAVKGGKEEDRLRGGGVCCPSTPLFPPLSTHTHTLSHPSPLPTLRAPLLATGHGGLQGGQLVGQATAAGGARHVVDREKRRRAGGLGGLDGGRLRTTPCPPAERGEGGGEFFLCLFRATDLAVSTPPSQLFPRPPPSPTLFLGSPTHTHTMAFSRSAVASRAGGASAKVREERGARCDGPDASPPFNPLTRRPWPRQA
jgi:hypothetical protein